MTSSSGGTTAGTGPDVTAGTVASGPDVTGPDTDRATGTAVPGGTLLALLALGWLAAMLWSARSTVTAAVGQLMEITAAAYALPGLISAGLVTGTAAGLVPASLLNRRGDQRAGARFAATIGAGLLVGLLAALAVTLGGAGGPATMALAGTTAAAAVIGGATAGIRHTAAVAAAVTGALAVFAVGFLLSFFQDSVLNLYGAGETQASQVTALNWFSRTASVASGLAAGLAAFGYLRLAGRRAAPGDPVRVLRWPAYLFAGLGAGLFLVTAEVLTRTAGASVLDLAGALSEADQAAQGLLAGARITHSMIVLFVGALTALIVFGRTLGPAQPADTGPDED